MNNQIKSDVIYHLVTTADERTWKFDRPMLFLGEWCLNYDRRHVWNGLDAVIAKPYGLGKKNKDNALKATREFEDKLLPLVAKELNKLHGVEHSLRYWNIVLGHWLRRYIDVIYNRYHTIQQCLECYNIASISLYGTTDESSSHFSASNSLAFIWKTNDDVWNNLLTRKLLKYLPSNSLSINEIRGDTLKEEGNKNNRKLYKKKIQIMLFSIISKMVVFFVKDDDAFIINTYLSKKNELQLQLSLGQFPMLWRSPIVSDHSIDSNMRQGLLEKYTNQSEKGLNSCLLSLLFELMPSCYLEGYSDYCSTVNNLPWPKAPRFIFTSNNFDTNEVFKFWVAQKVGGGSTYIVGQHGNNYGTYRYMDPSIEEITSDKFLTWGWVDGLISHMPAFILKSVGKDRIEFNNREKLLLIESDRGHRLTTWDNVAEFSKSFESQKLFVNKLDESPRSKLIIRLHHSYREFKWHDDLRWNNFDSKINIEKGEAPIEVLIEKSRLVIHGYDSTGMLETLAQNIPTMAFWENGLDHLRESAKSYYQLLIDAGIIHLSSESIALKINKIWDDVESWWLDPNVQGAREKFCLRYALVTQDQVTSLTNILEDIHE